MRTAALKVNIRRQKKQTAALQQSHINYFTKKSPLDLAALNAQFVSGRDAWLRRAESDPVLSATILRLVRLLAACANDEFFCATGRLLAWPSISCIAGILGISPEAAEYIVERLLDCGYISHYDHQGRFELHYQCGA